MDVDLSKDLPYAFLFLMLGFFYVVAYAGVVFEFVVFLSRAQRPEKIWRHVFETIILTAGSFVWLSFADRWPEGFEKWRPILVIAGIPILIAYLYSSYRKRVASFWVEVLVQGCLLTGLFTMTICTRLISFAGLWIYVGVPVDILFAMNILKNYQKWSFRGPKFTTDKGKHHRQG